MVSRATIARHLATAGPVVPEPDKRRKSSYIRFQVSMPNETWQADSTQYPLTPVPAADLAPTSTS